MRAILLSTCTQPHATTVWYVSILLYIVTDIVFFTRLSVNNVVTTGEHFSRDVQDGTIEWTTVANAVKDIGSEGYWD